MDIRFEDGGALVSAWRCVASLVAVALLVACAVLASACSNREVAATFEGETIYEDEVTSYTASFREDGTYTRDDFWALYLSEQGMTTATWRESAIREIAKERLVSMRASELGIEADAEQVASQIASAKEDAGVAADDGQAWADYLAQSGDTPELYRKRVEESLIEQQLLSQEIEFGVEDEEGAQLVQQYIDENYLARIAKRWSVLRYDTRKKAKAVLNSLADLEGAELKRAFEALLDSDDSEDTTRANGGDLGWDVALDMGSVQDDLNAEKVNPVHVSKDVHKQNGAFYVMMCTDRYVFERDSTYEDIPDEDLRSFILESATYENWSTLREEYLNKLVDEANVQVTPMPDGLDYDVDDLLATM